MLAVATNFGRALDNIKEAMAIDNKGSRMYQGFHFKISDNMIMANHPRISSKSEGLIFLHFLSG